MQRRLRKPLLEVERYALLALLGLVVLFFSLHPETSASFPTSENFQAILGNHSVLAIAALAAIVPLACGQLDLSIGAILGLSSIVTASLLSDLGWTIGPAATAGVAAGAVVGLVNGLLVAKAGMGGLIVTLGTATIISGGVAGKTGGESVIEDIPSSLVDFGSGITVGIPRPVFVLAAVAVFTYYVFDHTPFGRYLYSVGSNREAARLVGLNVDRLVVLSFVLSGALAGVAGALEVTRIGGGSPQIGPTFTLPALAAAFLGAAAIKPGRFNVGGTLVAVFFLAALTSGLNLAGADAYINDIVNGAALLVGVGLSTVVLRQRGARAAAPSS
jgi:ribose transport system permease protein